MQNFLNVARIDKHLMKNSEESQSPKGCDSNNKDENIIPNINNLNNNISSETFREKVLVFLDPIVNSQLLFIFHYLLYLAVQVKNNSPHYNVDPSLKS